MTTRRTPRKAQEVASEAPRSTNASGAVSDTGVVVKTDSGANHGIFFATPPVERVGRVEQIEFPFELPSLNDAFAANQWGRKKLRDKLHADAAWCIKRAELKPFTGCVELTYCVHVANVNRDADNFCGKAVTDTLVRCGVLKNDNLKHVRAVTYTGQRAQGAPKTVLEIRELGGKEQCE